MIILFSTHRSVHGSMNEPKVESLVPIVLGRCRVHAFHFVRHSLPFSFLLPIANQVVKFGGYTNQYRRKGNPNEGIIAMVIQRFVVFSVYISAHNICNL